MTASAARVDLVVGGEARQREADDARVVGHADRAQRRRRLLVLGVARRARRHVDAVAPRARAAAARPATPAKPTERMCGAASPARRCAAPSGSAARDRRPQPLALRRHARAPPRRAPPPPARRRGRARRSPARPRCRDAARAPARRRTASGASARALCSHSAPAPLGPWILCAESASESKAASATSTASLPSACTRVDVDVAARRPRLDRARDARRPAAPCRARSAPTCSATSAVSGRTAAANALGDRRRRRASGATVVTSTPRSASACAASRHRRMLEARETTTCLAARAPRRAAPSALASVPPEVKVDLAPPSPPSAARHLLARPLQRAAPPRRRAGAPTTGCPRRRASPRIAACGDALVDTRVVGAIVEIDFVGCIECSAFISIFRTAASAARTATSRCTRARASRTSSMPTAVLRELATRAPLLRGRRLVSASTSAAARRGCGDADCVGAVLAAVRDAFAGERRSSRSRSRPTPTICRATQLDGLRAAGVNSAVDRRAVARAASTWRRSGALHGARRGRARGRATRAPPASPTSRSISCSACPSQTLAELEADLAGVLALEPEHLSVYNLTVEERTAFGGAAARRPACRCPTRRAAPRCTSAIDARLAAAGLAHYEISS